MHTIGDSSNSDNYNEMHDGFGSKVTKKWKKLSNFFQKAHTIYTQYNIDHPLSWLRLVHWLPLRHEVHLKNVKNEK
jgi:hypothetical protein